MGDLIPFNRDRTARRQRIAIRRAGKFRIEMPVVLHELLSNLDQMSEVIEHFVEDFCEDKGAAHLVDSLRLVFVGGLDAARARDQAWFTDYISPGMILLCWECED